MTERQLYIAMYRFTQYGDNELTKLVISYLKENAPESIIREISEILTLKADDEIFEYMLQTVSHNLNHLDNLLEYLIITHLWDIDDDDEDDFEEIETKTCLNRISRLIELGGNINNASNNSNNHRLIREHLWTLTDLGYSLLDPLVDSLDENGSVSFEEIHQLLNAGVSKNQILNKLSLS